MNCESLYAHLASQLTATGKGGKRLRRRILRLIGGGDDGAVRLGRTGWVLGLLLVGGAALSVLAGNVGRTGSQITKAQVGFVDLTQVVDLECL